MNTHFWHPTLTTQFTICPVPLHLDTYRGCIYGCRYCFAQDFTVFSRRNSEHKTFNYLEGNDYSAFRKWFESTLKSPYDYNKGEEVAIKERIPIKIGATSDPFPPIEKSEGITYNFLVVLNDYDYPVEIQTKNPEGLLYYVQDFLLDGIPNWCIAVTVITADEKFAKVCEPYAPSPQERFKAIRGLVDKGLPVMVKIQPAIYPKIMDDLPNLVKAIKESGCWAFNIEGLKVRISMPKEEQLLFKKISKHLGFDIRNFYKLQTNTGSDYELNQSKKMEYINLALALAKQYNLKCFIADNNMGCVGDGSECCGTQKLRNYKIFANNLRSHVFPQVSYASEELGKCKVNFCRCLTNSDKTINEVMRMKKINPLINLSNNERIWK